MRLNIIPFILMIPVIITIFSTIESYLGIVMGCICILAEVGLMNSILFSQSNEEAKK